MEVGSTLARGCRPLATLVISILVGLAGLGVALASSSISRRTALVGVLGIGLAFVAFKTKRIRECLLFAWVVSLTLNRQYFVFIPLVGDQGSQGPYVIASDMFLASLLAYWFYEFAFLKIRKTPRGANLLVWYIPFAIVCFLSMLGAERMDWALWETLRMVKVAVVLWYIRYNFGESEWWTCVASLAVALSLQSAMGVAEVVSRRSGLLGIFGLGQDAQMPERFEGEFSQELFYGQHRATGTMSHPPNLACYMIMVIPTFLCLAAAVRITALRWSLAAVTVLGLAGLACTLSRMPWAICIVQLSLLALLLPVMRLISVKQFLGVVAVASVALGLVAASFQRVIIDRFTRDLRVSSEGRLEEIKIGLKVFGESPMFGVGLNNTKIHYLPYAPELRGLDDIDSAMNAILHLRAIFSPQNGFLHGLMEVGIVGFVAWLLYWLGVFRIGLSAVARQRGYRQAAYLGMCIGLLGVVAQQTIDFSYWVDPLLMTFALLAGMLAVSPVIEETESTAAEAA